MSAANPCCSCCKYKFHAKQGVSILYPGLRLLLLTTGAYKEDRVIKCRSPATLRPLLAPVRGGGRNLSLIMLSISF
jgi:hypothetical protein